MRRDNLRDELFDEEWHALQEFRKREITHKFTERCECGESRGGITCGRNELFDAGMKDSGNLIIIILIITII